MIIKIVIGLVLGILILKLWLAVVGGSAILGVLAVAFLMVVVVWSKLGYAPPDHVALTVAAMVGMGLLYGVPLWLNHLANRHPKVHALITKHINELAKSPLRIASMTTFAVALFMASIASFFVTYYLVRVAVEVLGKRLLTVVSG
jgi:hypothetical protein